MQFLQPLTNDPKAAAREKLAGTHLPYARHLDDVTLQLRNGMLMQTIQLGGLLFETSDTEELNYRTELRDAMLRSVSSSRFAIYHHLIRRRADVALDGSFTDDFSARLDERWRKKLDSKQMYVNELFVTIIRRPLQGKLGWAERLGGLFTTSDTSREVALQADRRALDAARDALVSALGQYSPKVLSVYETPFGPRSEPVEFLSCLFNGEMRPMGLPHGDIGMHLPWRRVSFGQDAVEHSAAGHAARQFTGIVSIKDYPGQTMPGMFDELYRLPFEMQVSQSFAFVERSQALGKMNLALRRMRSTEDEAVSLRDELTLAKDNVAAGRASFGEHHTTIAIRSDDLARLNTEIAEVIAILGDLGINAVREDIALEPSFWAQFPGNFKYIGRKGLISTRNFAGFASLHNFPVGTAHGNHWGDAVTLLETTAAGPYFFNFHQNDLGNFTIIGPSGAGKTVVLNFLLAQARRFAPRIIFFDKDRGAELFIRAIGGEYDRLSPGTPSGLNPLQLPDTPANRQFLYDWVSLLAGHLDSADAEQVQEAINATYDLPLEHRQLRNLVELFRGYGRPDADDLYSRLRPWWGSGERAWLFDNAVDRTNLTADTVGFDMTAILDDPVMRTPAMLYFFHRVEERLDGTPSIIVIDEGWKALDDDAFARRIKDWEKTIRKRNGVVGFATQSAQDALESKISSAIIEQAATQIFMINPKARAEDYINGFSLTSHEYELVRSLPDNSHCFLIKHGRESVVARLDLTGEREILTILSGRENTVRLFDSLSKPDGTLPDNWISLLLQQAA